MAATGSRKPTAKTAHLNAPAAETTPAKTRARKTQAPQTQAPKKPAPKMPTAKSPAAKSPPALPKALAQRARALHEAKMSRLAEQGRAAIARIREAQTDIAGNMVDIGLALLELKTEGIAQALGRASFAEICERDVQMAVSTANGLIALATKTSREMVTSLGPDRVRAVLELVEATPDDDTPGGLLRATLALPSGRSLRVADATTQELRDAAKELRAARAPTNGKRSRGFTATPAEKKRFAAIAKRLTDAGYPGATLIASRDPQRGARLRIEVPLTELSGFAEALRKAAKG